MKGYEWHCDECNSILNFQTGFSTISGEWICTRCGYNNDVTPNNIEHYGERPATYDQLRYIRKIEELLDITFYGSSFEEASDFIDSNKDLYQNKLHTPYKYR